MISHRVILLVLYLITNFRFSYSQDSLYVREVIRQLGSPEFHGRGYVNKGDELAAQYLAGEFKKLGLKAPSGKDYFQHFSFPVNTFPGKMEVNINGRTLVPGEDYLVQPGCPGVQGYFPVIRINRTTSFYSVEELKGKWLLLDTTINDNQISPDEYQKWLTNPPGGEGLLLTAPVKLTWSISKSQQQVPQLILLKPKADSVITTIQLHIEADFIQAYQTQNVIGFVEGTDRKDSLLFITAHYDHLGQMGANTYFPGANDNASGVAMLLSLARHFSEKKNRLPYTLVFIAFAGEEAGLQGSLYYTKHPEWPLSRICFLLNLDLLGTGDEGMMVVNATLHPELFQRIDSINKSGRYLAEIKQRGKAANSDHYWFSEAGVPSFFCYTLGGIKAYHDIYDRPETLPLTNFKESFQLFTAFLRSF